MSMTIASGVDGHRPADRLGAHRRRRDVVTGQRQREPEHLARVLVVRDDQDAGGRDRGCRAPARPSRHSPSTCRRSRTAATMASTPVTTAHTAIR
jgi:hypothetical protein